MEPVFIVREHGALESLGRWLPDTKTLELDGWGFPFQGPGRHQLDADLPWLFFEMAPSGFLGARFARAWPELSLPPRTLLWSSTHVLRAITCRGEDLPGNLVVGEESRRRYENVYRRALESGELKRESVATFIDEVLSSRAPLVDSSLGGERPKVMLPDVGEARRHMLLKFTPPLDTPFGRRWANLYALESLCAATLERHGIAAVGGAPGTFQRIAGTNRAGLLMPRFDRLGRFGRVGASTLSSLAMARGEGDRPAPEVMVSLAQDGLVSQEDATIVSRLHAFSAAIGNSDTHLGNYALLFDARGQARLAPAYDITAMVFAPRADELPDARVSARATPIREDVRPLVDTLLELVETSGLLDEDFKATWLRYVRG